jgi:hypothetical protein
MINSTVIQKMRLDYIGERIRCINMVDDKPVPSGTEGTVNHVDDLGQIHVKWDNGSTLALIPETDEFELVNNIETVEQWELS